MLMSSVPKTDVCIECQRKLAAVNLKEGQPILKYMAFSFFVQHTLKHLTFRKLRA